MYCGSKDESHKQIVRKVMTSKVMTSSVSVFEHWLRMAYNFHVAISSHKMNELFLEQSTK